MASTYGSVVKEAVVLLDQFNTNTLCLDDFMEDALKSLQNTDDEHRKFMVDVVYGCVEHQQLLNVVIDLFYQHNDKSLSTGDHSLYVILCYLITFVLEHLGVPSFGVIVKCLGLKKVHTFLNFFFTNLTTYIQEKWNTIYDAAYVNQHWIIPLLRMRGEVDVLMDHLSVKVCDRRQVKKTTEVQEFVLTEAKTRPLLIPEHLPLQEKPKPVPSSTYRKSKDMHIIEEHKQKNHHKAQELLYEANTKQLRCMNAQKSENFKKVTSQIEEDFQSKLKFNSFHSSRLPSSTKKSMWSVKLNSAAVLRQAATCERQLDDELHRVECLIQGAQEPSSFLQWQQEMHEKDKLEELVKIERRRLEGRISYEEAAMARTRIMEYKQKAAKVKKEETAEIMRRYAEKRLKVEKDMRQLVQQVTEGQKNSKSVQDKLQTLKKKTVKEVSEQSQELLGRTLEEAQAELSRRSETIRQIHALESVPHIRHKHFDDTETAGHQLLEEMSLAELRERLGLLKEARQRERQEKQEHIQEEKHNKQLLFHQLDTISFQRKALAQAAANRKQERKAKLASVQTVTQDETVLTLQTKLQEKRQERQRLKQVTSAKDVMSEQTCTVESRTHSKQKSSEEENGEDLEQSLERHIQKAYISQRKILKT